MMDIRIPDNRGSVIGRILSTDVPILDILIVSSPHLLWARAERKKINRKRIYGCVLNTRAQEKEISEFLKKYILPC